MTVYGLNTTLLSEHRNQELPSSILYMCDSQPKWSISHLCPPPLWRVHQCVWYTQIMVWSVLSEENGTVRFARGE